MSNGKKLIEMSVVKKHIDMEVIANEIKELWCVVCYLIINWRIDELKDYGRWEIPTELYKVVAEHLYNYVYKDKMPPKEIAQTIMNVADDFMGGHPVRFRTGDYIALENFRRSQKM